MRISDLLFNLIEKKYYEKKEEIEKAKYILCNE